MTGNINNKIKYTVVAMALLVFILFVLLLKPALSYRDSDIDNIDQTINQSSNIYISDEILISSIIIYRHASFIDDIEICRSYVPLTTKNIPVHPVIVNLIDRIKFKEGFRSEIYIDQTGNHTIGYGRNMNKYKNKFIEPIDEDIATLWLIEDLTKAHEECKKHFDFFDKLTIARKQAMIELVFNMGISFTKKFPSVVDAMRNNDYKKASKCLLYTNDRKTLYYKQVGKRADEVAYALEYNQWQ